MVYPNLKFPKFTTCPFFYTNFVQTVDGKVAVKKEGYWPIGSKTDHDVLVELRAYADCLIHGKNLSNEFGSVTRESLNESSFKKIRQKLGKDPILPYIIATHDLKELTRQLHEKGYKHVLVEGGPTLLGSFLKENLMDEIFLTIAPKIIGNEANSTLTLVEGYLFPPKAIKKLKLLSSKQIENELYLRYKILN
ncbi:dihydrofolate reductase family protein [Candidatus Microgenomates bacterium]|nr:dihydrofolate reductase family protein [Candidatus Microgenomates bacterium]